MNLWRVAIDETSGVTTGQPQALTVPAAYIRHFALSADGRVGTYATYAVTNNLARVRFSPLTATVDGPAEPITTGPRDFGQLDVNPVGRELAVVTSSRQQEDVFVVPTDGGALRQLTNDSARDRALKWSPDGRHILFYSDRSGTFELWSIDRDGSGLRQLTTSAGRYFPVPSRDGSKVAASDINAWQLYVYESRDFSKPLALPPFPQTIREGGQLAPLDWSPDGRQLAGAAAGKLWLYSFETKAYRTVTDVSGQFAAWLPDNRRVIMGRQGRLFVTDTLSGESRQLFAIPGEQLGQARLTADSAYLYFAHGTTSGDIWLVRFADK